MKSSIKTTTKVEKLHIGVDVSKAKLDIYIPAAKEGASPVIEEVENNTEGFRKLRDMARKVNGIVCVEPTGGYELDLIAFMHKSSIDAAYADALRVRQFARAEGNHSKNDKIDAALISRFADKIGVRVLEEQDMPSIELRRMTKLRQTLVNMHTYMKNRLETESNKNAKSVIEQGIAYLRKQIRKVEKLCLEIVSKNPELDSLCKKFTEVGGVANITAIAILAGLPEIGKLPDAKLNRLAGIAPEEKQSGTMKSKNTIWGGRKDVRNALYMATVASIIWNSKLSAYYHKKRAEGHPHKWAMIPTMRKLLSLLNRIARNPNFTPAPEPESTKKNALAGRKRKVA